MDLMGGRVILSPRPASDRTPALEAAMLGHLPGSVRLERLRPNARWVMRSVGLGEALDHLDDLDLPRLSAPEVDRVRALYHLPVPLLCAAELDDLFPEARSSDTLYRSTLAGRRAWLPAVVDDFFANGGERLWILRIPEEEGRAGFQARSEGTSEFAGLALEHSIALRGLAALLPIPELAVIAAPDLERLLIPAQLQDIPRVRLDNPVPAFAPGRCRGDDDHRERRRGPEMPVAPEPDSTLAVLAGVQAVLSRYRPDIQYLHSLPLEYSNADMGPAAQQQVLAALSAQRGTRRGAGLKRIQLIYPYLRRPNADPAATLTSAVGLVAGRQAGVTRRLGVWRSMAGEALVTDAVPYPPTDSRLAEQLRESPGVGVLIQRQGRVELEDERLVVPALHPDDYLPAEDPSRFDGYRSGEVARFMGWLLRRLRALGDVLVFDLDPRDPRPRLLLEDLLRRLHGAGALRGSQPEEAFSIREGQRGPGILAYDIELAPAFPVDKLRLTFANREGHWQSTLLEARGTTRSAMEGGDV